SNTLSKRRCEINKVLHKSVINYFHLVNPDTVTQIGCEVAGVSGINPEVGDNSLARGNNPIQFDSGIGQLTKNGTQREVFLVDCE
ncbi:hypothetical protein, partial [Natronoglomus mannanivorans]|nr:hypothetical protein [Halobacteria archaeon AArc-xg1-1]